MLTPALRFAPEVLLAAQDVRVVFLAINGAVPDEGGGSNALDRHGLLLLQQAGITPVHCSAADTLQAAEQSLATLGFDWSHAAAIGHDWPELPVLTRCAFAVAPADAHVEVRALAHHVTAARAGAGAVRELCDLLLTATGRYASALAAALSGSGA